MFRVRTGVCRSFAVLSLFLSPLIAHAQTARVAEISGQVTDRSGGAITGATVTLLDIANGESRSTAADDKGRYRFPEPAAGTYVVTAAARGFSDSARTVVVAAGAAALTADFARRRRAAIGIRSPRARGAQHVDGAAADGHDLAGSDPPAHAAKYWRRDAGIRVGDGRRLRAVPGAAPAARPRFNARARARERRAPQQRADGDGSRRHRGRPPTGSIEAIESSAAPAPSGGTPTRLRAR